MKNILIILLLGYSSLLFSQQNCFAYPEGSEKRKACEIAQEAVTFAQGSKESQMLFDEAIAIDPTYAWAYFEKSVPYLKRGFLYEGLQILNKAVHLEPLNYLCYRASWYWGYKNYDLCIQDLEKYYAMPKAYMQFTPGGEKDMKVILGLAYAKNLDYEKAIKTIEDYMSNYKAKEYIGFSDYHVLGIFYVHNKEYDKAIDAFETQFTVVDNIAESYYFLGLAYKGKSNLEAANIQFNKALALLGDRNRHRTNVGFPVYRSDIEKEMVQ